MQNYNGDSQHQQKDCVYEYDNDHLFSRRDENVQSPSFRLLLIVGHDEEDALGDDGGPLPHASGAVNVHGDGVALNEVVGATYAHVGERHLQSAKGGLAALTGGNDEFEVG
mmetsp:Transcript_702/g.390  ORF Transcript_702/g.390 Transcript_702/m.390 type:complete len:111 (-) Transcript_702:307-639(-)